MLEEHAVKHQQDPELPHPDDQVAQEEPRHEIADRGAAEAQAVERAQSSLGDQVLGAHEQEHEREHEGVRRPGVLARVGQRQVLARGCGPRAVAASRTCGASQQGVEAGLRRSCAACPGSVPTRLRAAARALAAATEPARACRTFWALLRSLLWKSRGCGTRPAARLSPNPGAISRTAGWAPLSTSCRAWAAVTTVSARTSTNSG